MLLTPSSLTHTGRPFGKCCTEQNVWTTPRSRASLIVVCEDTIMCLRADRYQNFVDVEGGGEVGHCFLTTSVNSNDHPPHPSGQGGRWWV